MEKVSLEDETKTRAGGAAAMRSETGGRRMVILALLLAMMVTAVEQLVVSPAMATIIAQLKGFEIFPWVASAYLLAATVTTPIYGKLADLFGRKPVLLFGLGLFSVGSVLSGTAMTMPQLIAMRAIQGLVQARSDPLSSQCWGTCSHSRSEHKFKQSSARSGASPASAGPCSAAT